MIVMHRRQSVLRNYKLLTPEKKVIKYLTIQGKMAAAGSPFTNDSLIFTYLLGLGAINAITTALNAAANGGHGTAAAGKVQVCISQEGRGMD